MQKFFCPWGKGGATDGGGRGMLLLALPLLSLICLSFQPYIQCEITETKANTKLSDHSVWRSLTKGSFSLKTWLSLLPHFSHYTCNGSDLKLLRWLSMLQVLLTVTAPDACNVDYSSYIRGFKELSARECHLGPLQVLPKTVCHRINHRQSGIENHHWMA